MTRIDYRAVPTSKDAQEDHFENERRFRASVEEAFALADLAISALTKLIGGGGGATAYYIDITADAGDGSLAGDANATDYSGQDSTEGKCVQVTDGPVYYFTHKDAVYIYTGDRPVSFGAGCPDTVVDEDFTGFGAAIHWDDIQGKPETGYPPEDHTHGLDEIDRSILDGILYGRQNDNWTPITYNTLPGKPEEGFPPEDHTHDLDELPSSILDGLTYARVDDAWSVLNFETLPGKPETGYPPEDHDHDDRYFTEAESNDRFVAVVGDKMTGNLQIDAALYVGGSNEAAFRLRVTDPDYRDLSLIRGNDQYPIQFVPYDAAGAPPPLWHYGLYFERANAKWHIGANYSSSKRVLTEADGDARYVQLAVKNQIVAAPIVFDKEDDQWGYTIQAKTNRTDGSTGLRLDNGTTTAEFDLRGNTAYLRHNNFGIFSFNDTQFSLNRAVDINGTLDMSGNDINGIKVLRWSTGSHTMYDGSGDLAFNIAGGQAARMEPSGSGISDWINAVITVEKGDARYLERSEIPAAGYVAKSGDTMTGSLFIEAGLSVGEGVQGNISLRAENTAPGQSGLITLGRVRSVAEHPIHLVPYDANNVALWTSSLRYDRAGDKWFIGNVYNSTAKRVLTEGDGDARYSQLGHTHTESDITDLNRLQWRGLWVQQEYKRNDLTRDGEWTMVANKDTEDRPAPQPDGDPVNDFGGVDPGYVTQTELNAKTIVMGVRFVAGDTVQGWVTKLDVFAAEASPDVEYEVWVVRDPEGTPTSTFLSKFATPDIGWYPVTLAEGVVSSGATFDVFVYVTNSGVGTVQFDGTWVYKRSNGNPGEGEINHQNNQREMRIDATDKDDGNRRADLQNLDVGDTISGGGITWTITEVVAGGPGFGGNPFRFDVTPQTRAQEDEYTFVFEYSLPATIPYPRLDGHYADPRLTRGFYSNTGSYGDAVQNLDRNNYGIDVTYQAAVVSDDWDLVALSGGSGGSGGSGPTLTTFEALTDTPTGYGTAASVVYTDGSRILFDVPGPSELFSRTGHKHVETDITDLDKYSTEEVDNKDAAIQQNLTDHITNVGANPPTNPHGTKHEDLLEVPTTFPPATHDHDTLYHRKTYLDPKLTAYDDHVADVTTNPHDVSLFNLKETVTDPGVTGHVLTRKSDGTYAFENVPGDGGIPEPSGTKTYGRVGGPSPYWNEVLPTAGGAMTGPITSTGAITTNKHIEVLVDGGVALTENDGGGNANVCFNHRNRTPDKSGSSARIYADVDSTIGSLTFQVADNVSAGIQPTMANVMNLKIGSVNFYSPIVLNNNDINGIKVLRWSTGSHTIYDGSGDLAFNVSNAQAARIEPAGSSIVDTKAVITAEKGDARYLQLAEAGQTITGPLNVDKGNDQWSHTLSLKTSRTDGSVGLWLWNEVNSAGFDLRNDTAHLRHDNLEIISYDDTKVTVRRQLDALGTLNMSSNDINNVKILRWNNGDHSVYDNGDNKLNFNVNGVWAARFDPAGPSISDEVRSVITAEKGDARYLKAADIPAGGYVETRGDKMTGNLTIEAGLIVGVGTQATVTLKNEALVPVNPADPDGPKETKFQSHGYLRSADVHPIHFVPLDTSASPIWTSALRYDRAGDKWFIGNVYNSTSKRVLTEGDGDARYASEEEFRGAVELLNANKLNSHEGAVRPVNLELAFGKQIMAIPVADDVLEHPRPITLAQMETDLGIPYVDWAVARPKQVLGIAGAGGRFALYDLPTQTSVSSYDALAGGDSMFAYNSGLATGQPPARNPSNRHYAIHINRDAGDPQCAQIFVNVADNAITVRSSKDDGTWRDWERMVSVDAGNDFPKGYIPAVKSDNFNFELVAPTSLGLVAIADILPVLQALATPATQHLVDELEAKYVQVS